MFEKLVNVSLMIAVNVSHAKKQTKKIYVSKHNSNREKQVTFLMIQMEKDFPVKNINIIKRNNIKR